MPYTFNKNFGEAFNAIVNSFEKRYIQAYDWSEYQVACVSNFHDALIKIDVDKSFERGQLTYKEWAPTQKYLFYKEYRILSEEDYQIIKDTFATNGENLWGGANEMWERMQGNLVGFDQVEKELAADSAGSLRAVRCKWRRERHYKLPRLLARVNGEYWFDHIMITGETFLMPVMLFDEDKEATDWVIVKSYSIPKRLNTTN